MPLELHLHDSYDPLRPRDLDAFEAAHKIKLPDDYRELLLRYNGGSFRHDQVCAVRDSRYLVIDPKGTSMLCHRGFGIDSFNITDFLPMEATPDHPVVRWGNNIMDLRS